MFKRNYLFLSILLVLAIPFIAQDPVQAQTYSIFDSVRTATPVLGTATLGRDTLITPVGSDIVELRKLDSIQVFLETNGAVNLRLLAAPVKLSLAHLESTCIADTVLVKIVVRTKSGVSGITYQELRQAFAGAVPPQLKFYVFSDSNATALGAHVAGNLKEYLR